MIIDREAQRVLRPDGTDAQLTPTEYRLVEYVERHRGRVVSYGEILRWIYPGTSWFQGLSNIRVYLSRIRSKLGPDEIEVRRGTGLLVAKEGKCPTCKR